MGFPSSPANEAIYTNANGTRYQYDSTDNKWIVIGGAYNVDTITANNFNGVSGSFNDIGVDDEVYGSSWNGKTGVLTKNAIYDKIHDQKHSVFVSVWPEGVDCEVVQTLPFIQMGHTSGAKISFLTPEQWDDTKDLTITFGYYRGDGNADTVNILKYLGTGIFDGTTDDNDWNIFDATPDSVPGMSTFRGTGLQMVITGGGWSAGNGIQGMWKCNESARTLMVHLSARIDYYQS